MHKKGENITVSIIKNTTCTCSKVHDYQSTDKVVEITAEVVKCIDVKALGFTFSFIKIETTITSCVAYKHKDLCEQPECCIYKCSTDTALFIQKIAEVSTSSEAFVGAETETKSRDRVELFP